MRTDVMSGMLVSNLVMWFIIITTASTLFHHGIKDIDSASKAAEALRRIAGRFASVLFTAGIVGTGLLAVPISPVRLLTPWRRRLGGARACI